MATGNWRAQIKDESDNVIARVVGLQNLNLQIGIKETGEASFSVDIDDPVVDSDPAISDIFSSGIYDVEVLRGDTKVFRGRIDEKKRGFKNDDGYIEITSRGYFGLFAHRLAGKLTDREFVAADGGLIAWTLIDESQSEASGDLGLTQGVIAASNNRTITLHRAQIDDTIRDLADADGGFDWEITPNKVFNVYYPYKGSDKTNLVIFKYPGTVETVEEVSASGEIINYRIGLGTAFDQTEIISTQSGVFGSYGRREDVGNYREVPNQAVLDSIVLGDINRLSTLVPIYRFTIDAEEAPSYGTDWNLGDIVTLRIATATWNQDVSVRIMSVKFTISPEGKETIELTTANVTEQGIVGGVSRKEAIPTVTGEIVEIKNRLRKIEINQPFAEAGVTAYNYLHNLIWTATDNNTASWSAGTIYFGSGANFSILAGNTGNIVATTYVFLDINISDTTLQTTTTIGNAIGNGKALLAIVAPVTAPDLCEITAMLSSGSTFSAQQIVADYINGNKILATSSITIGTGNNIVILSGSDATYRIWVGNVTAALATFRVTQGGVLTATGATITGTITATLGAIGGWVLAATTLTSAGGGIVLSSVGDGTITGGVIRTSSGGNRVQLNGSNDRIEFYEGGSLRGYFRGTSIFVGIIASTTILTDGSGEGFAAYAAAGDYFKFYASGGHGIIASTSTEKVKFFNSAEASVFVMIRTSDQDVTVAGSDTGILLIGNIGGGEHIAIDKNEIMAKDSDNTSGVLTLNNEGNQVTIGGALTYTGLIAQGSNSSSTIVTLSQGKTQVDKASSAAMAQSLEVSNNAGSGRVNAAGYDSYCLKYAEVEQVDPAYDLSVGEIKVKAREEVRRRYEHFIERVLERDPFVAKFQTQEERDVHKLHLRSKDEEQIDLESEEITLKKRISKIPFGTVLEYSSLGVRPARSRGQTNIAGVHQMNTGFRAENHRVGIDVAKFGSAMCRVKGICRAGDYLQVSNLQGVAEIIDPPTPFVAFAKIKSDKNTAVEELVEVDLL